MVIQRSWHRPGCRVHVLHRPEVTVLWRRFLWYFMWNKSFSVKNKAVCRVVWGLVLPSNPYVRDFSLIWYASPFLTFQEMTLLVWQDLRVAVCNGKTWTRAVSICDLICRLLLDNPVSKQCLNPLITVFSLAELRCWKRLYRVVVIIRQDHACGKCILWPKIHIISNNNNDSYYYKIIIIIVVTIIIR